MPGSALFSALLLLAATDDGPQAARPAASAASAAPTPAAPQRSARVVDGERFEVLVWGRADADTISAAEAALDEVQRVVALLSSSRPDASLARVNAGAGRDSVVVAPEVFDLLLALRRIEQLSGGAFDLTAGVLDDVWGFTDEGPPQFPPRLPTRAELAGARPLVSGEELVLDPVTGTARLRKAGARVDVRGALRGHALVGGQPAG
jgi:thiamine biosynthesis lipoprotein